MNRALLTWFAREARVLPWREQPRDPYRVWVSEVMLQQTRVETVLRYYAPFLTHFPDVASLATASEDALMKTWEGLGYYRRARLLQQGARHVLAHGMPTSRDAWLLVPGVGPYTAGAIASLCRGERVAAVDGNVLRVFSRVTNYRDDITAPAARRATEAWVLASQPRATAGAFNEALMELGATVCTPAKPTCTECPWGQDCQGRAQAASLPNKPTKPAPRDVEVALAVAWRGPKLLLEKRETGLLAGTWGLPWVEGGRDELAAHVAHLVSGDVQVAPDVTTSATHTFTHRRWSMRAYEVETLGVGGTWKDPSEVALGSAHKKVLRALLKA